MCANYGNAFIAVCGQIVDVVAVAAGVVVAGLGLELVAAAAEFASAAASISAPLQRPFH